MKTHPTVGLCVLVALLACKKGEDEKKAEPVPTTPVATAPPPATTSAAAPEETAPSRQQTATGLPTPTDGTSKPPTVVEWGAAKEITVRHSTPLGCETKLVREWLRVSCRTKQPYITYGVKLTSGKDHGGIPPFVKPGVASIVTQVKQGMSAEYTFDWGSFTRKLTVAWPNGTPNPTIEFDSPPPK